MWDHLALRLYENSLCLEDDPACRWCGEDQETISHIFQECPQLYVERADGGISNPSDLWSAPHRPWDSPRPLCSSLDSITGSQGKPTPRYTGVRLRADALVASAVQESAGGAKQQQPLDATSDTTFTNTGDRRAYRQDKDTSSRVSNLCLKHLELNPIKVLTDISKFSPNKIPNSWKLPNIVPILKPNKPT